MGFSFRNMENKWKKVDQDLKINSKETKYFLNMFPYPSGRIHVGHVKNYTITDVITRFFLLNKVDVFNPIGWDAFGLPAENAAIAHKTHPKIWTEQNIENMKKELQSVGFKFNWSHEMSTHQVEYYKFQQEIFRQMYKAGLICRKKEWVNWDPVEQTVLANEQIDENGRAWRSKAIVEKRYIYQWFCKTTNYAQQLLDDLKDLKGKWPDKVINMQKNWIGKSNGYTIEFKYNHNVLPVFTTRPETIYGCTFLAVSSHSPYIETITDNLSNLQCGKVLGYCTHPLNNKQIPIYLADYVIGDYGTGIVMGAPSQDERDRQFAHDHKLPIIDLLDSEGKMINSHDLNGLTPEQARKKLHFKKQVSYRLRDWCISRQRYWGCPIPMIHCEKCGIIVNEETVVLPDNIAFENQKNILNSSWKHIKCPQCSGDAQRETDTMDTFFDSSWYFLRFPCVLNKEQIFDEKINMTPMDLYVGGIEHANLHLLYSRFMLRVLKDLKLINHSDLCGKLVNQGMICHPTYRGKTSGEYYFPSEVEQKDNKYYANNEEILIGKSEKMSKSLKNTIQVGDIIDSFGADTIRLFIISDTPIEKDSHWDNRNLRGCWKFLNKVWEFKDQISKYSPGNKINNNHFKSILDSMIIDINNNFRNLKLNIVVANLRSLFTHIKEIYSQGTISQDLLVKSFKFLIQSLWCICPFICYEIFQTTFQMNILDHDFMDPNSTEQNRDNISYSIKVLMNGKKLLGEFITEQTNEDYILERALNYLPQKNYKTYKYIQNKLINFLS